jgi:hypothetical protein
MDVLRDLRSNLETVTGVVLRFSVVFPSHLGECLGKATTHWKNKYTKKEKGDTTISNRRGSVWEPKPIK